VICRCVMTLTDPVAVRSTVSVLMAHPSIRVLVKKVDEYQL